MMKTRVAILAMLVITNATEEDNAVLNKDDDADMCRYPRNAGHHQPQLTHSRHLGMPLTLWTLLQTVWLMPKKKGGHDR